MPVPITPDGPHAIAFNWFADRIQKEIDSGTMAGQVEVYRRAMGAPDDLMTLPIDKVGIQLRPEIEPTSVVANYAGSGHRHIVRSPILIYILVQTPGAAAVDGFNLIDLIEDAIAIKDADDEQDAVDHFISWTEWVNRPSRSVIQNTIQSYSAIRLVIELVR